MEESKHPFTTSLPSDQHNQALKARLNNNQPFQRAQHQVFANVSRLDILCAYSLATGQGCQSLARTRQLQINSLISRFASSQGNTGDSREEGDRRRKAFRKLIRQRFNQPEEDDDEEESPQERELDEEDDDEYFSEEEEEEERPRGEEIETQPVRHEEDVLNIRDGSDEEVDVDMDDQEENKSSED